MDIYYVRTGGIFIGYFIRREGWLLSLTAGVVAAVCLAVLRSEMMYQIGMQQMQTEQVFMNWTASTGYLCYLFLCRGLPFYLLVLLTWRSGRQVFLNLYLVYCGFSYGVQAVLMTLYYQMAGILLFVIQLFPHILFYGAALYLCSLAGRTSGFGGPGRHKTGYCLLFWTLGIICEWYLNPLIMTFCMKNFL